MKRPLPSITPQGRILAATLTAIALMTGSPLPAANFSWDSAGASPVTPAGGTGNWNLSSLFWSNGTSDVAWTDSTGTVDTATFGGTAGTVTLTASLGAKGLIFNTTGYTIATGANTLTLGSSGIDASALSSGTTTISGLLTLGAGQSWNVGTGATLATSAVISGANSLTKTGAGTVTLSGANTFSGGLTVSAGTVSIAVNTALGGASGTAGAVTLNGGTLQETGGAAVVNTHAITIGASGGTINVSGKQYVFNTANTLLGSGALTIIGGAGTLADGSSFLGNVALNAANTYNGNITLQNGGSLEINNNAAVGSGTTFNVNANGELIVDTGITLGNAVTVSNGGELSFNNGGLGIFAGNITLNGTGAAVRLANFYNTTVENGTITGNISGTGGITISNNAATLTLMGANTYTGNTVIGTGATLVDTEPTTRSYSGAISGAGTFVKDGSSTLTLTGVNTYTGATIIRNGTLTVGNGTSGSLASTTTLTFGDTGTFNYQGVSTGSSQNLGATTFSAGAGTVQSTYGTSGNTSLTLSNVAARTAGATANFVVSGGTLTGATPTNKIVFTQVAGAAPVTATLLDKGYYFNGADFAAYDTNGYVRALAYGTDANSAAVDTITAADNVKLTAAVTGQNSISLLTLNLSGSGTSWANNTSQTLSLSAGGLIKSGGGTAGTISGGSGITTGGATEFVVRTDTTGDLLDIQTAITATSTGGLTKTGAGTLTLSAANAYTGVTTVDQGTLSVTGSIGSTGNTVVNGGILSVSGSGSINPLSGTGSNIMVGNVAGAQAAIYQSGASSVVKNTSSGGGGFAIGSAVGGMGYYNVSGGTISVGGEINVGGTSGGAGTFGQLDMSGGTMNLGTQSNTTTPYFLPVRGGSGEASVVNISGGTVQVNSGNTAANSAISGLAVGLNNLGSLYSAITISGTGQFLTPSHTVKLNDTNFGASSNATNTSVLNMNGGLLQTLGFGTAVNTGGGNGSAVLNFNGGVVKAGTAGNTSFLSSLGAVNIYSGGGTIDNNAQAITIGQALLGASGTGVSSIALSSGGAGYIVPPRVVFVGGVTTGGLLANTATGYATIDPTTGAVTGIVITNPGCYTSTAGLSVQLVGGGTGTTGATLGSLTLNSGNTSGGMTFQGSGTTTLTGANTYTGGTTITAGTLAYGASNVLADTGAINVNGGTLSLGTNSDTVGAVTLTSGTISSSTGVLSGSSYAVQSGAVSAILGGTGSTLTKSTSGSVTLSGVNTYTGATTVNAGTLTVSGTGSINNSSGITINGSGAKFVQTSSATGTPAITLTQGTLDGTGTVGAVTVGAGTGGIVSNGNGSTAKLTVGSLTFSGAGTFNLSLAGGATTTEALTVTNAFTTSGVANSVTVNLLTPTTPFNNITYNLVGYGSFSGNLSDFVMGTGLTSRQSGTFGTSGNFLTLTIAGDAPKWTGLDNGNWVVGTTGSNGNWKLITAGTATDYIAGDTVLFDDSATGTTTVNISGANVAPTLTTFNNSAKDYVIGSTGGFGISSGAITKNGTGKVTITNANTFTGATTINAGSVNLQNSAALGATSGITVASGAALELQGGISVGSTPLAISGAGLAASPAGALRNVSDTNSYAGLVTLGSSATIQSDAGSLALTNTGTITGSGFNLTLAGVGNGSLASIIGTGAGSVIKNGAGTWTLSGANTYTGGTTINGGTIIMGNAAALGASTNALAFGAAGNGTLTLNGNSLTLSGGLSGDGTATINNSNATAATLTDTTTGTDTYSGALADGTGGGALALTKTGTGTLVLGGTNTYSGATTISTGTLRYNGASAMSGSSALTVGNGATLSLNSDATNPTFTPGGNTVLSGGATFNVGNISSGTNQTITLGGTTQFNAGNTLNVTGSNGYSLTLNAVTTNGVSPTFSPAAGTTLNIGSITNNGGTYAVFNFAGGGNTNVTGSMTNAQANRSIALVFNQTGTVTLSGTGTDLRNNNNGSDNSNTYVNLNSGTVNFNTANAIRATNTGYTFTINGGTIDNTSGSAVTLAGIFATSIAGDFAYGGTNNLDLGNRGTTLNGSAGSRTITTNGSATLALSGAIGNGSSTGLIKAGTGTLDLTAANTYTGGTIVNAGTLILGNAASAGTGTLTSAGGTIDLGGKTITNTLGALTGGGVVNDGTITNNSGDYDLQNGTVGAVLDGSNGLNKTTSNTVTLNAANTYTGVTTISAGTLVLGTNGSIAASSGINLGTSGSHGTLDLTSQGGNNPSLGGAISGYGTINVGAGNLLTLTGTLAPAGGVVSVTGNLALDAFSSTSLKVVSRDGGAPVAGTDYDQISVSGTVTFNGTLNIDTTGLTSLVNGDTFHLFSAGTYSTGFTSVTMTGAYAPTFVGSSGIWTGSDQGYNFTFNESTGDLSVAGSAIPEPATCATLLGVAALLGSALRRRRRRLA